MRIDDKHIKALTGLRAFAAFCVVLHHLLPVFNSKVANSLVKELNIGVSVFFVLSGFLITHRYFHKIEVNYKWTHNYIINRIARIYPMFFLLTTSTFFFSYFVTTLSNVDFLKSYFLNITLLKGFFLQHVYSGIAQSWTLTVEECFYFSAPFVFLLIRKWNFVVPLALIYSMVFMLFFIGQYFSIEGFFDDIKSTHIVTYFGRVFEFFWGILLALNFNRKAPVNTLLSGIVLFVLSLFLNTCINYYTAAYAIQTWLGIFINATMLPLGTSLLIHGLSFNYNTIIKFFSSNVMLILGKSSYTLYLLHWGFTSYIIRHFIYNHWVVDIVLTYVLSILLWHFVEEPLNLHIRKRFTIK